MGERERRGHRRLRANPEWTLEQDVVPSLQATPARTVLGTRDVEASAILATREVVGQDARRAGNVRVRLAGVLEKPGGGGSGTVQQGIIGHPQVATPIVDGIGITGDAIPLGLHASLDPRKGERIGHEVRLVRVESLLGERIDELVRVNVLVGQDPQKDESTSRVTR